MTSADIWSAANDLAVAIKATPRILELSELAPASRVDHRPLSRVLNEFDAGGAGITSHPLRLFTQVNFALSAMPDVQIGDSEQWQRFLSLANRVEAAHHALVAWLRSRLPGYPMILVPQLVREAALTTQEFTYRYPWRPADLAARLQFQPRVVATSELLDAEDPESIRQLTSNLAEALRCSNAWQRYQSAHDALTADDAAQLKAARVELRQLVAPEQLNAYEPRLALPRYNYREHHTREVVESLTGASRDFALAFDAVNGLIDLVAAETLAQLVRFDDVIHLTPGTMEFDDERPDYVTVHTNESEELLFATPGRLIKIAHPLIADVGRVEALGYAFQNDLASVKVTCRLLANSSVLLKRSP
ncbi:hypothetical protein SAMN04487968_11722 [Nocardioides terrae]|uniref:Uncharacterized protein n=2 Tax=Nocardioides terrae TaxID=574651 RepID=A0A1I1NH37_9ACTN|nr:hypothetical protein SAMN04487968_11722 [Nocardioides terrae]